MFKLPRLRDQPYLLLALTSLFWAGNAIVGRAVVHEIPPVALAQMRWTFAFLILLPFAWTKLRGDLPVIRRTIGVILLLSLTGIATFNTLLYWSLQHTTAINATLMQSSGPLLIGLASWVLFRDPLTRLQMAGIVISLSGVAVIVSQGEFARLVGMSLNIGDVMVVVAMAAYAVYSTLLRKRPAIAPLSFVTITMGIGALMLVPLTIAEHMSGRSVAPLDLAGYGAIVYVAIFPSILSYIFFNRGVELIGANRAGPFFHLIPLFGVVLAFLVLGERPALYHLAGAALILGGVALASRQQAGRMNRVASPPASS
jgi:drug/metabolite transporter (DMT)-like permease